MLCEFLQTELRDFDDGLSWPPRTSELPKSTTAPLLRPFDTYVCIYIHTHRVYVYIYMYMSIRLVNIVDIVCVWVCVYIYIDAYVCMRNMSD